MLLRYAGLRLVEVFALRTADLDVREGLVHVGGAAARLVPLPPTVTARLRLVLEDPALFCESAAPAACDAGYVRRCLVECGEECGLPKGLLNARALRAHRALELGRQGLPLPVLEYFLGRSAGTRPGLLRCDAPAALAMLQEHLHTERPVKTSARNVFQGRVVSLRSAGLLVEVVLAAVGGLRVTAVITDESCRNLDLKEGTPVNAGVKAPWVMVEPYPKPTAGKADMVHTQTGAQAAENCFPAVVERVREDDLTAEITAALPDGSPVCALLSKGPATALPQPGDRVRVLFKAFAVVVNRD